MVRQVQLRDLFSGRFLGEIHHLLWLEASLNGEAMDGGWNCRDHAWATALLSLSLGYTAALVSGEAFYSRGGIAGSAANHFNVKPHGWAWVDGVGAIDLSVKPVSRVGSEDFRIPIKCVFAGEWIPRGRCNAYFLDDAAQFARAVEALPNQRHRAAAFYLAKEAEYPHAGHLTHAAGWIGSALTTWLDARYGNPSDVYAALLMHLRAFLEGKAPSLAKLPFEKAWAVLADDREGAIDRARRHIEARADRRAAFHHDQATAVPA